MGYKILQVVSSLTKLFGACNFFERVYWVWNALSIRPLLIISFSSLLPNPLFPEHKVQFSLLKEKITRFCSSIEFHTLLKFLKIHSSLIEWWESKTNLVKIGFQLSGGKEERKKKSTFPSSFFNVKKRLLFAGLLSMIIRQQFRSINPSFQIFMDSFVNGWWKFVWKIQQVNAARCEKWVWLIMFTLFQRRATKIRKKCVSTHLRFSRNLKGDERRVKVLCKNYCN